MGSSVVSGDYSETEGQNEKSDLIVCCWGVAADVLFVSVTKN